MNKPDWSDSPSWAEWLAEDSSGEWYWYELKPTWEFGRWNYSGAVMLADPSPTNSSETLEQRP